MPDPQAADGRDPPPKNHRRKLGEMLVDAGILSPDQLEEALRRQKVEKGTRLGRLRGPVCAAAGPHPARPLPRPPAARGA